MLILSELGKRLKLAREEKQLSLDDLQESTKIQKRYLAAIESGEFSLLPGTFYARAFIKNYAEALGLDYDALSAEFQHELPNPHESDSNLPSRSERISAKEQDPRAERQDRRRRSEYERKIKGRSISRERRSFFTGIVPIIFVGIGVVLIAAAVYIYVQKLNLNNEVANHDEQGSDETVVGNFNENLPTDEENVAKDDDHEQREDERESEQPNVSDDEQVTTQTLERTEIREKHSYFTLSDTERFNVEIRFSGKSYMDIKNKEGKMLDILHESKEGDLFTYDFSDQEMVDINIGAIQHAMIFVNGEQIDVQEKPVHQHIIISYTK